MELSVLQWNIGNFDVRLRPLGDEVSGMRYTHASPSRAEDLPAIAALIRERAPDIATLQEVLVREGHHLRLAKLTGYRLAAAGGPEERHTQALLVRPGLKVEPGPAPEGFRGVCARVWAPGGAVLAVSTHSAAGLFTAERAAQHRALAEWARRRAGQVPTVAGGDFNIDDDSGGLHANLRVLETRIPGFPPVASSDWDEDRAGLAALRAEFTDCAAAAGPTAGAPERWPEILLPWAAPLIPLAWALGVGRRRSRLDYVWARGLRARQSTVLRVTGAAGTAFPWMDHDPVLVRVEA